MPWIVGLMYGDFLRWKSTIRYLKWSPADGNLLASRELGISKKIPDSKIGMTSTISTQGFLSVDIIFWGDGFKEFININLGKLYSYPTRWWLTYGEPTVKRSSQQGIVEALLFASSKIWSCCLWRLPFLGSFPRYLIATVMFELFFWLRFSLMG